MLASEARFAVVFNLVLMLTQAAPQRVPEQKATSKSCFFGKVPKKITSTTGTNTQINNQTWNKNLNLQQDQDLKVLK